MSGINSSTNDMETLRNSDCDKDENSRDLIVPDSSRFEPGRSATLLPDDVSPPSEPTKSSSVENTETEDPQTSTAKEKSKDGTLKLMSLNDNKAGMTGLDKEKINAIIQNASKGSKFYAKQQENQARIDSQVGKLKLRHASLSSKELLVARQEADSYIHLLNQELDLSRTIVHVDMDMFYAAVEMRDNPDLRDKPMAVGGVGMLSTSNYAARKFGVRAAMPGFIGKKLCPELVIVPGNMDKYANESKLIREVFREYDENFAPMSLDEAYMDLTDYLLLNPDNNPSDAVQEMRSKITEKTQLTASAGIAPNTFLAKVCSDLNKPNGQYLMDADQDKIIEFVTNLPIRKAPGIGNVQEQLLKSIGVETCGDLYELRAEIKLLFSQLSFEHYMQVSQGIGSTRLEAPEERIRKSISTETTFKDTSDRNELLRLCDELSAELSSTMNEKQIFGKAVSIKIKSHDFKIKTKIRQIAAQTNSVETIRAVARQLLQQLLDSSEEQPLALRLLGVRMSELKSKEEVGACKQKSIFSFLKTSEPGKKEESKETEHSTTEADNSETEADNSETEAEDVKEDESVEQQVEQHDKHASFSTGDGAIEEQQPIAKEKICRQKSISSFLETSPRKRRSGQDSDPVSNYKETSALSSKPSETKYFCPVCGKLVPGLQQLNDHVDRCLLSGNENTSETEDAKVVADNKEHKEKVVEANSPESCKPSTSSAAFASSTSSASTSSSKSRNPQLTCPVCFNAEFDSELYLNRHIDECLSSKEIQNVLKGKSTSKADENTRKRKSDSSACGKSAMKKGKMSVNKIDSYFRRS